MLSLFISPQEERLLSSALFEPKKKVIHQVRKSGLPEALIGFKQLVRPGIKGSFGTRSRPENAQRSFKRQHPQGEESSIVPGDSSVNADCSGEL